MAKMLPALQAALSGASQLPVCKVAGPWARGTFLAHGSYLLQARFSPGDKRRDLNCHDPQRRLHAIDNHGGSADFFRFGDMELNRQK